MLNKKSKGIILTLRESNLLKGVSTVMLLSMLFEYVRPTAALALTEGPSQPEVQSFEPINTSQMVNAFTGDFNYNLPLMNVPGANGGYPINIDYHAGVTMDDEASWVGLGWNLNVGNINRNVRGIPDEFNSELNVNGDVMLDYDHYLVEMDMKKNTTFGLNVSSANKTELFGKAIPLDISGLGAQFSIFYNNFTGFGGSAGVTIGDAQSGNWSTTLSLNSESGLGVSIQSPKPKAEPGEVTNQHGFSLNFSGEPSLSYSLSKSKAGTKKVKNRKGETKEINYVGSSHSDGFNYSLGFNVPQTSYSSFTSSLSMSFLPGVEILGIFAPSARLGGNLSITTMDPEWKDGKAIPVMGYEESHGDQRYQKDFARNNPGPIVKGAKFLPNSFFNYDHYSMTGQGMAGTFIPKRNDKGATNDPTMRSGSGGVSVSADLGAGGITKTSFGVGANFGWTTTKKWDDSKNTANFEFKNREMYELTNYNTNKEHLYYGLIGGSGVKHKSHFNKDGGLELDEIYLKDEAAPRKQVDASTFNYSSEFVNNDLKDRSKRGIGIDKIKNEDINVFNTSLGEFKVRYYNADETDYKNSPTHELNRITRNGVKIDKHGAGIISVSENGSRYVYGLPVYNQKEVEAIYSVPAISHNNPEETIPISGSEIDYKTTGSDKFKKKTTKSPYITGYRLTSILGADYVDVTNDGPTDDDLGYWVKFDYTKVDDNFKWRAPYDYTKGMANKGAVFNPKDDKISYQYGEKELWYLARIETSTHVAIFNTKGNRNDFREAINEHAGQGSSSIYNVTRRLNNIQLFSKQNMNDPLQEVVFETDYSLCKGATNLQDTLQGKLTLNSLYFKSQNSLKGQQQKYSFDYNRDYFGIEQKFVKNSYDSWGMLKKYNSDDEYKVYFPYVTQFDQDWFEKIPSNKTVKEMNDQIAGLYNLNKITMPSGSEITVDYEMDDYGHVQHMQACQMFKIVSVNDNTTSENQLYDDATDLTDIKERRVYFKMEKVNGNYATDSKELYKQYIEPMISVRVKNEEDDYEDEVNLYYKVKMDLRHVNGNKVEDFIMGYHPLDLEDSTCYGIDPNDSSLAYVTLKKAYKKNGTAFTHHPFALAGWSYLQGSARDVLYNNHSFNTDNIDQSNVGGKLLDFFNFVPQFMSSIGSIRGYCKSKNMAKYIDLDKSCIRLASPDKVKYGGGHRVARIKVTDNWNALSNYTNNVTSEYGTEYDYTVDGYSSGVAQNEPQLGGDENALRYPYYFNNRISLFSNTTAFVEAPFNKAQFPSPIVGYSQVTIKSTNTQNQLDLGQNAEHRTAGVVIKKFYTAKDYPTIEKNQTLSFDKGMYSKEYFNLPIWIPLVGTVNRKFFHGTQAYFMETNNMHGQARLVEEYGLVYENDQYHVAEDPYKSEEYIYQDDPYVLNDKEVKRLNNKVEIIDNNDSYVRDSNDYYLGVEVDLATDMVMNKTFNNSFNLQFNLDVIPFPIPIPSFWPEYSNSKSMFKTYVTNKVVSKRGLVSKTIKKDFQTSTEEEILAYDRYAGNPILKSTKNEFGDLMYNYTLPAYYKYEGMGFASDNLGMEIIMTVLNSSLVDLGSDISIHLKELSGSDLFNNLYPGDEFVLVGKQTGSNFELGKKAYFIGWTELSNGRHAKFIIANTNVSSISSNENIKMSLIRSGKRNMFSTPIANYLTKGEISLSNNDDLDINGVVVKVIPENVLSANASLFRDSWYNKEGVNTLLNQDEIVRNPYTNGTKGIWRPYQSYTYVGLRNSTLSLDSNYNNNPDLRTAGVMDSVPMFNWDIGYIENSFPNWEWTNEITRYSKHSYESENINRLGVLSSALYGYTGSLSTAVGSNAGIYEMATEDFEMYKTNGNTQDLNLVNENHLMFGDFETNSILSTQKIKLHRARMTTSNQIIAVLDISPTKYDEMYNYKPYYGLELISIGDLNGNEGNKHYYFNASGTNESMISTQYPGMLEVPFNLLRDDPSFNNQVVDEFLPDNSEYVGYLVVPNKNEKYSPTISTEYVEGIAHTGKKSMKVSGVSDFKQPLLKVRANKPYILSFWMKTNEKDVMNYFNSNMLNIKDGGSAVTPKDYWISNVIEGWQKVDVEVEFTSEFPEISLEFNPQGETMFIDDIRFGPKVGGMQTYVFDPETYRLESSLSVDNYSTLYGYDEEGNLTLSRQETEEGIFTVSESRGNVNNNN